MAFIKTLKGTAQDFTDSWADYGGEIGTDGRKVVVLWLNIVINNTQSARFRVLAKHISGGVKYVLPISVVTASIVNIEDEYYEIVTDEDERRVISFTLDNVSPFVQVQIQAGVVGIIPGHILDSKYTLA